MSLRKNTPCDYGECPYEQNMATCEYYCGADEPADEPDLWDADEQDIWDEDDDYTQLADLEGEDG